MVKSALPNYINLLFPLCAVPFHLSELNLSARASEVTQSPILERDALSQLPLQLRHRRDIDAHPGVFNLRIVLRALQPRQRAQRLVPTPSWRPRRAPTGP